MQPLTKKLCVVNCGWRYIEWIIWYLVKTVDGACRWLCREKVVNYRLHYDWWRSCRLCRASGERSYFLIILLGLFIFHRRSSVKVRLHIYTCYKLRVTTTIGYIPKLQTIMTVSLSTTSDVPTEKDEKRRDRKAKVEFPTKVGFVFWEWHYVAAHALMV